MAWFEALVMVLSWAVTIPEVVVSKVVVRLLVQLGCFIEVFTQS